MAFLLLHNYTDFILLSGNILYLHCKDKIRRKRRSYEQISG